MSIKEFFIQNNIISIPLLLLFISMFIKIVSKIRADSASLNEMKDTVYFCGVELSFFSLTIYLCEDLFIEDFFGVILKHPMTTSIMFSAKFYTITLCILLMFAILCYRSYKEGSILMILIGRWPNLIKTSLKVFLILISIFCGLLSIRLLVELVNRSIKI